MVQENPSSSKNSSESSTKQKFWRGPRPLDPQEKKMAKKAFALALFGITTFFLQMVFFLIFYTSGDWLCMVIFWITFLMPAYLANAGMLMWGGKGPALDFGHVCKDGRRLFGPGKTWRGFFLGPLLFGIPIALLIHYILYINWGAIIDATNGYVASGSVYTFYSGNNADKLLSDLALYLLGDANAIHPEDANINTFLKLLPRVILCAFGAPVGDLVKSYFKRRRGLDRGEPWWFLDQIDFILGCLLFAGWYVFESFNIHILIMTLLITPTITVVANTISYVSGHKKVPW